jgi:hypothetical protein
MSFIPQEEFKESANERAVDWFLLNAERRIIRQQARHIIVLSSTSSGCQLGIRGFSGKASGFSDRFLDLPAPMTIAARVRVSSRGQKDDR